MLSKWLMSRMLNHWKSLGAGLLAFTREGANVNRVDAALIGSGVGIIFHHSAGSNKRG